MLSQNILLKGKKKKDSFGFSFFLSFLIISLRMIFVVWLLLIWESVFIFLSQHTKLVEKWYFFLSKIFHGKKPPKKTGNFFHLKVLTDKVWKADTGYWKMKYEII